MVPRINQLSPNTLNGEIEQDKGQTLNYQVFVEKVLNPVGR